MLLSNGTMVATTVGENKRRQTVGEVRKTKKYNKG